MKAGFFQRDSHGSAGGLQRIHGALRSAEVAAQQNQDRRFLFERAFCVALKASAGTRGVSMKIRRRMRQGCFPGAVRKILRFITAAWIEDSQAKINPGVRLHCYSSGVDAGGGVGRRMESSGISSLGWTRSARRISFGVGVTGSAR